MDDELDAWLNWTRGLISATKPPTTTSRARPPRATSWTSSRHGGPKPPVRARHRILPLGLPNATALVAAWELERLLITCNRTATTPRMA
eukprot:7600444-Pyramimonas_sp.AAC.1